MTRIKSILIGTAVAGTLDILGAAVLTKLAARSTAAMLRGIASAVLGSWAHKGGLVTAAIGLVVHFVLMAVMVGFYLFAADRFPVLRRHALILGPLYGLGLYLVMNLIVLPLRWPDLFPSFPLIGTIGQIFCHVVLVGATIGVIARRERAV